MVIFYLVFKKNGIFVQKNGHYYEEKVLLFIYFNKKKGPH
jgi:hypothetical protein